MYIYIKKFVGDIVHGLKYYRAGTVFKSSLSMAIQGRFSIEIDHNNY